MEDDTFQDLFAVLPIHMIYLNEATFSHLCDLYFLIGR